MVTAQRCIRKKPRADNNYNSYLKGYFTFTMVANIMVEDTR